MLSGEELPKCMSAYRPACVLCVNLPLLLALPFPAGPRSLGSWDAD